MRNTIIVIVLLFLAVIGAAIYFFGGFDAGSKKTSSELQYLPDDALFVASFQNEDSSISKLADNEKFKAILGNRETDYFQQLYRDFLSKDSFKEMMDKKEILLAYYLHQDSLSEIIVLNPEQKINEAEAISMLKTSSTNYSWTPKDTLGHKLYQLTSKNKPSLYLSIFKNSFYLSPSLLTLTRIFDPKIKKFTPADISFFTEGNTTEDVLNIYLSNSEITRFSEHISTGNKGIYLKQMNALNGLSSLKWTTNENALLLQGKTEINNAVYLKLFENQSPKVQALANYFSNEITSFMDYSLSDVIGFQSGLKNLLAQSADSTKVSRVKKNLETEFNTSFEKEIVPAWEDEFAVGEDNNGNLIGLISITDTAKMEHILQKLSTSAGDSIYQFKMSNLLLTSFGEPFQAFERPYFTIVDKIMVVANRTSTLSAYRKKFSQKQFLSATTVFKNHAQQIPNRSNVTFYIEPKTAKNQITQRLTKQYADHFRDENNYGFQKYFSFSVQLSGNSGSFQSTIAGLFKNENRLGGNPEWTMQLSGRLLSKPWILNQQDGKSKFILIQEQNHTVHALSADGNELWKSVFQGEILGSPMQLQDRSIVVNTRTRLYRFKPDGTTIFSKELENRANYGATISTIDGHIAILIPSVDEIKMYDISGSTNQNFNTPKIEGQFIYDLKTATVGDSTYYVAINNLGTVYFFDKTGKIQRKQSLDTQGESINNPIGIMTSSTKQNSFVFVPDNDGNIYKIPFEGSPEKIKLGEWNKGFSFNFEDITGNADREFIILYKNKLRVYNSADNSLTFEYPFLEETDNRPNFFNNPGKKTTIGISTNNRQIYIFGNDGLVREGFPIEGLSKFYFGPINYGDNSSYLICVRNDYKLYAYKF